MKRLMLMIALIGAAWSSVNAQGLGKVVARQDGWELRKIEDGFSDKTSCVIALKRDASIQVSKGVVYLSYDRKGGLQSFEYRIDDLPSTGLELPSRSSRQIGIIELRKDFPQILEASRLRVQVLTLVSGIKNEDVNLKGLSKLYTEMSESCPNF